MVWENKQKREIVERLSKKDSVTLSIMVGFLLSESKSYSEANKFLDKYLDKAKTEAEKFENEN